MIVFKGGDQLASGERTGLGSSFRGILAYLEAGSRDDPRPDRVAWVSFRNLPSFDKPSSAAGLMRACAQENRRVDRPVYHFGLSLDGGERLTREQWAGAVERVLDRMGLAQHQAVVVAHRDTAHDHVHLVVNRIGPDGRRWSVHDDKIKARDAVRAIERELGLTRTGAPELAVPTITSGSFQEARRIGEAPLADRVRELAAGAFAAATDWRDLEERLARQGFRLEPASRGSGLLVTDGRRSVSLSHVDRSLSGPQLAERFGSPFRLHRAQLPEIPALPSPARPAVALAGTTVEERAAALLARITETRATFTLADLRRAAFHHPDSAALVRQALASEEVLGLGRGPGGAVRYTTREYLEAEARLLTAAARLAATDHLKLDRREVAHALDRIAPALSLEQRRAVHHATAKADLAQIVGRAGAGKTTAARAIAAAYEARGIEVRGAALAGKAAEVLEQETGIRSRTLASLERAWAEGSDHLAPRSVLVIDEAGMIDARTLGRVLAHAEERGAKVILLGDPDQLKAIGAGDAYRGLLEQHASAEIGSIRRQREPWQRGASEHLAAGRVAAALDHYEARGHLHWAGSRAAARTELLDRYTADRKTDPAASRLVVAYTRADAAALNASIRAERQARGELAPGVTVGRSELSTSDRIVFLRNDHQGREVLAAGIGTARSRDVEPARTAPALGVKNGTFGTVLAVQENRITVRLDDGRHVAFDPARYSAVAHGYAVTIHKAQGTTVDRVYVLADPLMNRHATYVALTRHRHGVQVFADRESFASREQLDKALSRDGRKDLASDYASAELRRAVARYQEFSAKAERTAQAERPLREALAAFDRLREARLHVVDSRRSLAQAAAEVYTNPRTALRALLTDRAAPATLRAGRPATYGELRDQPRRLASSRERERVRTASAALAGRLESHERSVAALAAVKAQAREASQRLDLPRGRPGRAPAGLAVTRTAASALVSRRPGTTASQQALRRAAPSVARIRHELTRVATAARAYRHAAQGAQNALEVALRGLGRLGLRTALLLLPPKVSIPVGIVARAAERVISKALDLGRGR